MAEVHGHVCVTENMRGCWCLGGGGGGAALAPAVYAWVMDTPAPSISLPTNQPYMILRPQMQNTPIMDAVIK